MTIVDSQTLELCCRPEFWFWDSVVLVQTLALATAQVFATALNTYFQLTVMLMILMVGGTALPHFQPFESSQSQRVQVSSSHHPALQVCRPVSNLQKLFVFPALAFTMQAYSNLHSLSLRISCLLSHYDKMRETLNTQMSSSICDSRVLPERLS